MGDIIHISEYLKNRTIEELIEFCIDEFGDEKERIIRESVFGAYRSYTQLHKDKDIKKLKNYTRTYVKNQLRNHRECVVIRKADIIELYPEKL